MPHESPSPASPLSQAPFPRAIYTFVGRRNELTRVLDLLERETLFFVYGVGGVGKSELVYKIVDEARALARWRAATPILLQVRPGFDVERLLAMLRARLDVAATGAEVTGPLPTTVDEDLVQSVRALDAAPHLVLIDDAHHLEPTAAARLFGALSRYVRESRIFVTSRLEMPLPADAPAPVVTRLAPLGVEDTQAMVSALARRLGVDVPDASEIFRRSSGSPFFIQREMASLGRATSPGEGSLEQSLRELSASARRLLLQAAVMRGRLAVDDLRNEGSFREGFDSALAELVNRFLIDVDRGVVFVHDLIRDALAGQASDHDLADARRLAASFYLERFVAEANRDPLDIIEAVRQRVSAGDGAEAWDLVEAWYRRIAAAGLDHLLMEDLQRLGSLRPERSFAVELLTARILVRRSLIDRAQDVLDRVARSDQARRSYRYLFLAGEVAQRVCDLDRAEALFQAAREAGGSSTDRFQAALQIAGIHSLRGDGEEARRVLDASIGELEWPSLRHRGRWAWHVALSYTLQDRQLEAAQAAQAAARELADQGLDDLVARLAMLETAARVETDEQARARELLDDVLDELASSGALREHVASLYRGVVLFGEGDMRGACVALDRAVEYLSSHHDVAYTCIAGLFLTKAHRALGQIDRAQAVAARTTDLATRGGLEALAARMAAVSAHTHLASGDSDGAGRLAEQVLACPRSAVRARMLAHLALARIAALAGDAPTCRAGLACADALVAAPERAALQRETELERAEQYLLLGDMDPVVDGGERARAHYTRCGRAHMEARACVIVAAGYVARGGQADLVLAEGAIERARELIVRHGYQPLGLRLAWVEAAWAMARGEAAKTRELLTGAIRSLPSMSDNLDARALQAALQSAAGEQVPPGLRNLLARLGLQPSSRYQIVDRDGARAASDADVERERQRCELVVEVDRGLISGQRGQISVKGRPVTCKLLAALVESQPHVVSAESLYVRVWGGAEYHPLRHRNMLYVALNRLRRTLREMFPERELIETVPDGWRLADGLSACSIALLVTPDRSARPASGRTPDP
jgi:DNA-binding winged helix-turn-helix (wHTH) protein/tetratricopeptide (TPR) repeat protein